MIKNPKKVIEKEKIDNNDSSSMAPFIPFISLEKSHITFMGKLRNSVKYLKNLIRS